MDKEYMAADDLAFAAFDNEIMAFPVSDENRQYKALKKAYQNAGVYAPHDTTLLRREIKKLARDMGYTLRVG